MSEGVKELTDKQTSTDRDKPNHTHIYICNVYVYIYTHNTLYIQYYIGHQERQGFGATGEGQGSKFNAWHTVLHELLQNTHQGFLNPKPEILNPKPKPQALNPKPQPLTLNL